MTRALTAIVALVAAAGCTRQTQPAYTFTALSFPGATATAASGLDDAAQIVGTYWREDRAYGFVYKDGEYTSIEHPRAAHTQLHGISGHGDIAGSYRAGDDQSGMAFHAFVKTRSGAFREIRHPDFQYGMAMGISADGSVVGCYHNEEGIPSMRAMTVPAHAFTEDGVTLEAADVLETPASMHNGTAPDGRKIVGTIFNVGRGYVIDGGVLRHVDVPDAKRTEAWGVSSSGAIVGVYMDAAGVGHGYLLENGRLTDITVPDAKSTSPFGINTRGDIVGAFETADGQRRGFLATRK